MASSSPDVSVQLLEAYLDPAAAEMQHIGRHHLPSEAGCERVIELCRALLFPGYAGEEVAHVEREQLIDVIRLRIDELRIALRPQVSRALHHKRRMHPTDPPVAVRDTSSEADAITERFIARLPEIRREILLDLHAAFESDPAATGIDEILLTYPGTYAISVYRIAHALLSEHAVIIPRMLTEIAHRKTGIDIHPGARIGHAFFIDHGTGVVIGETSKIGDRVRIYQGVTLGALSVPQQEARPEPDSQRHPTLEDDVVIYANATILGGETRIGAGAVVGGNAFVTASVAPGVRVSGRTRSATAAPRKSS